MRWMPPYIDVPGDNFAPEGEVRDRIMGRSGEFIGGNAQLGVWRFGFSLGSESSRAYGVHLPDDFRGFLWVLATRKTGKVRDTFEGYALELPNNFRKVIDQ